MLYGQIYYNICNICNLYNIFHMARKTRVVCVANRKGGTGKSTLTMFLAAEMATTLKWKVVVLDCDEQKSVANLAEMEAAMYPDREPLVEVRAMSPVFVRDFLTAFGSNYHAVFIDVPRITESKTDAALGQILTMCDCVLVPVLGSTMDAMATRDFLRLVSEIAEYKHGHGIPFHFFGVLNRFTARKDNEHAMAYLSEAGLPMFDAVLNDLKVFAAPSVYFPVTATAEGERRFRPFFDEFCKRYKIK